MKPSIARNIDIFSAFDESKMKDLKNWSDYDITAEIQQRIGIKEVKDAIFSELSKLEVKNFFFEFSLLPSVLDPTMNDKLVCMSYCTGDPEFNSRFGICSSSFKPKRSAYEAAIETLVRKVGISIYQYPNFLLDIGFDKEMFKSLMKKENVEEDYRLGLLTNEEYKQKIRLIIKKSRKTEIEDIISISCIEPQKSTLESGFAGRNITQKSSAKVKAILMDRHYKKDIVDVAQDYYRADHLISSRKLVRGLRFFNTLQAIHEGLHKKICASSMKKLQPTRTYYVSFPVIGTLSSNQIPENKVVYDGIPAELRSEYNPLQGVGACFIFFEDHDNSLGKEKYTDIKDAMVNIFEKVNDLIRTYSANYIFNLGLRLQAKSLLSSLKSAKAAIMSRNMSHNLGSHVMAYLKQHLNSVRDMIRDNILSDIFLPTDDVQIIADFSRWKAEFEKRIRDIDGTGGIKEFALPFLVGLGKFISYLQERQDFIATIATDYIPYLSAVNFKDFIYDELNPDLRYERHKDRIGMKPDNILLGNIARSEGLARATMPTKEKTMSDIIIKFRDFDGHPIDHTSADCEAQEKSLEKMRGLTVSLPGGVVGRQAIFSIVENVIRNAAKHGKWGQGGAQNLELTFDQYDLSSFDDAPDDDNLFDSLSLKAFLKKFYSHASDIAGLYVMTLTDNMVFESGDQKRDADDFMSRLVALERAITEPYVESNGEMVNSNKGIKEMRISAAWMRLTEDVPENSPYVLTDPKNPRYSQFWKEIDGEQYWIAQAPILMARASKPKGQKDANLQYIFCLEIPKMTALITDRAVDMESISDMAKHFWIKYDLETFIVEKNKSYEFILVDDLNLENDDRFNSRLNELRRVSPNRVIMMSQLYERGLLSGENLLASIRGNYKSIEEEMYRILAKYDGERILISDKKTFDKYRDSMPALADITDGAFSTYMYRTHHETEVEFLKYINQNKRIDETHFVEGITGNNSTDRLIRNDLIDNIWVYKHLHAMKTSVAVFDERIFSKIYKKDEMDIVAESKYKPVVLPEGKNEQTYVKGIVKKMSLNKSVSNLLELNECLSLYRMTNPVCGDLDYKGNLEYINRLHADTITGDYMAIAYEMKGVSIFNLVKVDDGLDIYGYAGKIRGKDAARNDKYYSLITKLGEIRKVDGKIKIDTFGKKLKFDYLSIHQGLLDKIYESFDIKRNAREKHEFTKLFYETFAINAETICYSDSRIDEGEKDVYYLPNLRIHSGRSKPSFADMPQQQPFIQYAAIEHAVMDCKYSLVELLDFARYE